MKFIYTEDSINKRTTLGTVIVIKLLFHTWGNCTFKAQTVAWFNNIGLNSKIGQAKTFYNDKVRNIYELMNKSENTARRGKKGISKEIYGNIRLIFERPQRNSGNKDLEIVINYRNNTYRTVSKSTRSQNV